MAIILAIETTTKNCSVALFDNGILLQIKEQNSADYSHAEQLTLFIKEVVRESNITLKEVNAIALSMGPGSYTGLRIGTSTAKGLCYVLDIPLISISTLKAMALGISEVQQFELLCPMIDAKRMEVFAAIYDKNNKEVREVRADIVDKETYAEYFNKSVLFFGDGAIKCKEIINNTNAKFIEGIYPSAKDLGALSYQKFVNKNFEDIAYFEPYYLKDFVAGKKKY
jgi:tRNA threonylcarbamoyladenosine biosynthesis protein TsaB